MQDGITGETRDLQYTQCKIVGNGSFGVVFQTKLSPSGEDAAIKRVLQDKRFKVCVGSGPMTMTHVNLTLCRRIVNFKLCGLCGTRMSCSSRLSTTPMGSGYVFSLLLNTRTIIAVTDNIRRKMKCI